MTVSIRLQGLPNEVDHLLSILEKCPGINIDRTSRPYLDRNTSSVRRYLNIELKEIDHRMFDENGILINGHSRMVALSRINQICGEEDHNG